MTTLDEYLPDQGAWVKGTLFDNDGDGASLQSDELYMLKGFVDGALTSGAVVTAGAPPLGSAHILGSTFRYYGPAIRSSIATTFDFSLSPHDTASFDSVFFQVVPEPGTLLLVGAGLAAIAARCRG